jgi:probable O-glycosylation ligase (exosortase A-associated)
MRDILVVVLVAAIALSAFRRPWIGVIGWTWIGLMNPHKQAWGFATSLPVAYTVAMATLIGFLATRKKRWDIWSGATVTLLMLVTWMAVTIPFAFYPDSALKFYIGVIKIQLMIYIAMFLILERKQIHLLVLTIVLSLGYYGIKGGLFTVLTGGGHRVWGPAGTFIEGNNELALALITAIPLMHFLQLQTVTRWKRHAWSFAMFFMAAAALGSQSRGALLAIAGMTGLLILRSRNRFGLSVLALVAGGVLIAFMPEEWSSRMSTINAYEEDTSAMSRLDAWTMAYNVAKANVFGGGFEMWTPATYGAYFPTARLVVVAHSIYFQVLGELGFIGLGLYLLMWGFLWFELSAIARAARQDPARQWMVDLARLAQVSLVGYLLGGAFLSLAYWDMPYNLIVLSVCLRRLLKASPPVPDSVVFAPWFERLLK